MANNLVGTFGAYHVLSIIPDEVVRLELNFDSIAADEGLTNVMANRLKVLSSVQHLAISLFFNFNDGKPVARYLKSFELDYDVTSYSLVLSGNKLSV